ncbi:MAG: GMC family oxidoreductase N-terminal domain-containing protein [Halobacteriota archaeon]
MKAIIVGSGAGGSTVAKELSGNEIEVTLIEKGPKIAEKAAFKCYANVGSEVNILRTICLGGTTTVSAGNGVRALEKELRVLGIDLSNEFEDAEKELGVNPLPDSHFGDATKRIMAAAEKLGFVVKKMPKFIDHAKCNICSNCASGCPNGAKWSATEFVTDAEKNGAKIITDMPVDDILVKNGEVAGVRCGSKILSADIVVLSAGALETPLLLKRLGLPTTPSMFVDTFTTIGGVLDGIELNKEIVMNAVIEFNEFVLYPHFSNLLLKRMEERGLNVSPDDILGLMVKIKDEAVGDVNETVEKGITNRDAVLLSEGASVAGAILAEAGADPSTFVATPLRGAHPGGTARIGEAVDKNMATEVNGLYVADASVLPATPGAPPILTIVALAKYVSKIILGRN